MAITRANAVKLWIKRQATDATDTAVNILGGAVPSDGTESDYLIVGRATSLSLSTDLETVDATTKDNDGAQRTITTGVNWSISVDGFKDASITDADGSANANAIDAEDLFKAMTSRFVVDIAWSTGAASAPLYTGKGVLTSFEESAEVNQLVTFSMNIESSGPLTVGTVGSENFEDIG